MENTKTITLTAEELQLIIDSLARMEIYNNSRANDKERASDQIAFDVSKIGWNAAAKRYGYKTGKDLAEAQEHHLMRCREYIERRNACTDLIEKLKKE